MRRLLYTAAVTAAAGGVLLVVAGRRWGTLNVAQAGRPRQHVAVTGHDVSSSLPALGIALLALSVALIAANGWMRRIAGIMVVLLGASAVPASITGHRHVASVARAKVFGAVAGANVPVHASSWWLVGAAAGLVAAVAGVAVAVNGNRWAGMGRRYDAPAAAEENPPEHDAWSALDRGEDPTAEG